MENIHIPDGFYKDQSGNIIQKTCDCGKKNQEVEDCESCKPKPMPGMFGANGWLCPACGRGNSPFSSTCPCKPFPQWPVIFGSPTPFNQPTIGDELFSQNQTIS